MLGFTLSSSSLFFCRPLSLFLFFLLFSFRSFSSEVRNWTRSVTGSMFILICLSWNFSFLFRLLAFFLELKAFFMLIKNLGFTPFPFLVIACQWNPLRFFYFCLILAVKLCSDFPVRGKIFHGIFFLRHCNLITSSLWCISGSVSVSIQVFETLSIVSCALPMVFEGKTCMY